MFNFYDSVELKPVAVDPYRGSLFETKDSNSETGYSLDALVDVTFAGIFTKNNGFYLPDRMQRGVESFFTPYLKPVQVHHDRSADPIGRTLAARYIDTSGSLP